MTLICTIDKYNGVPTIFINGEPKILLAYKLSKQDLKTHENFTLAGYDTVHCNIKIDDIWLGPESLDFQALHYSLNTILEANPNCFILTELHANAPDWWIINHPEELHRDRSGQVYSQSMASRIWREETQRIVEAYVHETEEYYGNHVILYLIGAGHTWEWFHRTPLRYVTDCSPAMRQAFIDWLRKKYHTDDYLREAWGINTSFDDVDIPEWSDVITGDLGSIRDPHLRRYVCDFFFFYNELMADLVIDFGKVVKNSCNDNKLFGAFYGHLLDWLDNPLTAQHSGHFCLKKVMDSKVVDVVAGPNSYMNREAGHEASFTTTVASVQMHNKLWLAETDTRTHLADPIQGFCGRPNSLEESIVLLKRDFCHALVSGVGMVWFSLFEGWFSDPSIMAFMGQSRTIASTALHTDRSSVAQIAVLVDEDSIFASTGRDAYRVDPFISREPRVTDLLSHMGCPYDIFLASDLDLIDVDNYKVFLFTNSLWLDEDLRFIVNNRLKKNNNVLVWFGSPGIVRDRIHELNLSNLIGMRLSIIEEPSEIFIRIMWDVHPITQKTNLGNLQPTWVDGDFEGYFGTNQLLNPRAYVNDNNAIPLGLYSRDGRVGFAVRAHDTWSSVFIGAPFAPPAILRQVAKWAGVHLYNISEVGSPGNRDEFERAGWNPDDVTNPADDILYVNDNFLALHAKYKGYRRILLPQYREVIDIFNNMLISRKTKTIEIDCPGISTYLFYIGQIPWKELL